MSDSISTGNFVHRLAAAKVALQNVPIGHDVAKAIRAIDEVVKTINEWPQVSAQDPPLNDRLIVTMLERSRASAKAQSMGGCAVHVNTFARMCDDGVPRIYSIFVSDFFVSGSTVETYVNGELK